MPSRATQDEGEDSTAESLSNVEFVGGSDSSEDLEPAAKRGWVASVVVGSMGLVSNVGLKALQFTAGRLVRQNDDEDRSSSRETSAFEEMTSEEETFGECDKVSCADSSSSSWGTARMYSSPGTMEVPPLSFPLRPPQLGHTQQDVLSLMRHRAQETAPYGNEQYNNPEPVSARPRPTTLLEAIMLYREDPSDYTGSLIQSALAGRGVDERISCNELEAAGGDKALVTYIVKSGLLDVGDPGVVKEIQECIDETVTGMESDPRRVDPVEVEFLYTLLETPHVVITMPQRRLLRGSGFEFVRLLHDFPACQEGINRCNMRSKCWWMSTSRHLQTFLIFIMMAAMATHSTAVVMLIYYWYDAELTKEFSTFLLCFLGCHVVNNIAVIFLVRMKAPSTVYGADSGDFPTVYLKIVPGVPLLEFFCLTSSFRHQVSGMRNIVLFHDVFAMATVSSLAHSMTQGIIMVMLGIYFLNWQTDTVWARTKASPLASMGWQMLAYSSGGTIILSTVVYIWLIFAHDSVSTLGFALFGNSMTASDTTKTAGSIFARLAAIILLYLFLINGVLLTITLTNIGFCSTNMIVWTSLSGAAVVITLVIIVWTMYSYQNFLKAVRWAVIPLVLQLAFIIFNNSTGNNENDDCRLFFVIGGVSAIVGYVGWGSLLVVCVLWAVHKIYSTVRGRTKVRAMNATVEEQNQPHAVG